jgi:hypothetical protein
MDVSVGNSDLLTQKREESEWVIKIENVQTSLSKERMSMMQKETSEYNYLSRNQCTNREKNDYAYQIRYHIKGMFLTRFI